MKVKTCCFGSTKWFWPSIFSHDVEDGKWHTKDNKYDLTNVPCFYWSITMIGLGDLLLVVSHLFAVPILVL
jgi:hypothetical protein